MVEKPSNRARASRSTMAEPRRCPKTGTGRATIANTSCSVVAFRLSPAKATWGGARNRADRASEVLADRKVDDLLHAARFALATGRTFQRHWIVHYGRAGVAAEDGAAFVRRLLDPLHKLARRAGGELTALWVREHASTYGEHVHILLHLPFGLSLRNRTRRWIEAAGGTYQPGVSMVTSVGGRLVKQTAKNGSNTGEHHRANAANLVRYLLKSASGEMGNKLGLTRHSRGGRIIGKRCGWTQNIGAAARKAGGWTNDQSQTNDH